MNKNYYLFVGGELDGKRIKVDLAKDIYCGPDGDYYNEQILGNKEYFFYYLHEDLEFNDGIKKLLNNYKR